MRSIVREANRSAESIVRSRLLVCIRCEEGKPLGRIHCEEPVAGVHPL